MPKSKSDTHITPDRVFEIIEKEFYVKKSEMFDPCPENFTIDGLKIKWKRWNFVNPPYTLLNQFVKKAIDETNHAITIMLLPAKTDQQFFHDLLEKNYKIVWIRKRLKFKNNRHHSMQPHFLVKIQ